MKRKKKVLVGLRDFGRRARGGGGSRQTKKRGPLSDERIGKGEFIYKYYMSEEEGSNLGEPFFPKKKKKKKKGRGTSVGGLQ